MGQPCILKNMANTNLSSNKTIETEKFNQFDSNVEVLKWLVDFGRYVNKHM